MSATLVAECSPKILLVGWDGADWLTLRPLMEAGRMANLRRIVEAGVSGDLRSFPPYLSPMLWNTIATGHHPAEHGVVGFTEWDPEARAIRPVSNRTRRRKALWSIFSQEDRMAHVVGWFASHPAEPVTGICVSEVFGRFADDRGADGEVPADSIYPAGQASEMRGCRVAPAEIERGLLRWFMPDLTPERLARDERPQKLLRHLAQLYSNHNAAIDIATHQPGGLLAVYFYFLDCVCHDFAELAPPRRPSVSAADFELYRHVVDRACELQDLLLGELLGCLGPETSVLVVSDHGFWSGAARPAGTPSVTAGIAAWHRPVGILAAAGPLFRSGGGVVEGATLFDIAPTVLHAAGLPVGRDMPGRPLVTVAGNPAPVGWIESWEARPARRELPRPAWSEGTGRELLRQFQDLGYVSRDDDPFDSAEELTRRENAWNLGHALLHAGRVEEALGCFETAWFYRPEQAHVAVPLARCQARLGLADEARATLATVRDFVGENPEVEATLADLALELGDYEDALALVQRATARGAGTARMWALEGRALLHLGRFSEAEAAGRAWLVAEPAHPRAWLVVLRAVFLGGRLEEARGEAGALVAAWPQSALGWFTLGQIESKLGQAAAAEQAHARAHRLRPDWVAPQPGRGGEGRGDCDDRDEFVFCTFPGIDFRDSPERSRRAEAEKRVEKLRAESRGRIAALQRERAATRAGTSPLGRLEPAGDHPPDGPPIVVVSGLPRSGTSLLMQMLVAGGLPAKTDGVRQADEHNPRGFYEWEVVKALHLHPHRLREAAAQAVKVVSAQVPFLPRDQPMRILWMERDLSEVVRSQEAMMLGREPGKSLPPREARLAGLTRHRDEMVRRIEASGCPWLRVEHAALLARPESVGAEIAAFLGELLPHPERMPACVDPALHRQKGRTA